MKTKIGSHIIDITGEKIDIVIRSPLFLGWFRSLDDAFTVHSLFIQSVDLVMRKGKEEILFLKFKADITDKDGRHLPGIIFLRGASVGILIILETEIDQYVVLIESAQPAIGKASYLQLPAGMMDNETDAISVALRETEEETGFSPKKEEVINLTRMFYGNSWRGIYPSTGACDEVIELFLYRKAVTEKEIAEIQGRKTGLASEHEHLVLKLVKLKDLCRITPNVKAHSAYMMYTILKEKGELL